MATNYPGGQDTFDTIPPTTKMSEAVGGRTHRAILNDVSDAVEAVELELGTDPSGSETNVVTRLAKIEDGTRLASNSITATQIAANAVGASELADNAVDTNAIADSAVTSAKIADGTITATDVAAGTFAAFSTVGNLLTANQANAQGLGAYANCSIADHSTYATVTVTSTGDGICGWSVGTLKDGETGTVVFQARLVSGSATNIAVYVAGGTAFGAGGAISGSWATYTATATVDGDKTGVTFYIAASAGAQVEIRKVGVWKGSGGQWSLPGVPVTGQSEIAVNGAVNLSGTGSPEGVVVAAPGSTWLQTDATTDVKGWIRWIKATGTGNTGWVAGPEADTGWRSLDATAFGVDTGKLTLGKCHLRRVGPQVFLSFYGAKVGTSGGTIAVVPAGFRPADADDTYAQVRNFTSKLDAGISNVNTVGQINWDSAGLTDGNSYIVTCTFAVTAAWPSSLPGSAA